jgi:23S rRNA (cytosine1962-C5)-methyltransferase
MKSDYELIDSGNGRKLERFGPYVIARPCAQAAWRPVLTIQDWDKADAHFSREPENRWSSKTKLPDQWTIDVDGIQFKISPTDFGHLGIFPEQRASWSWIRKTIENAKKTRKEIRVLNLFAYSGGSTLASALAGADVCHLDASKGMVTWANDNAKINNLEKAPIRWIIDDVNKFLKRELRRGKKYDGIILDPPTFGRGAKGEVFKIEEAIQELLDDCRQLLTDNPLFVLLSCHTPGFTPMVLRHLLDQTMPAGGHVIEGEMLLEGKKEVFPIPSGTYAIWSTHKG